ncbi:hypothetical protein P3T76_001799 [Phytophthora citrophthora]|uniref:Secreted protein n=1 Tax=Phytophthora citrophthora TaxID=4793 RepID=A0AAD9GY61_9STRA|nr:hypothetical protein P3T76_001799 [Phytophthora citrophthora]
MLLFRFYSIAVILVLVFRVIRPGAAVRPVKIHEVNESPTCNTTSTAMFSVITPTPCSVNEKCIEESGAAGNSTLYGFCNYNQAEYLSSAYSDTPYVLIDHYSDSNCEDLTSTDVYRADGKCHNSLNYALQVDVASNGTVAVKSRSKTCELGDWSDVLDPVPATNVNSGLCFVVGKHKAKLYLIDGKTGVSTSSASSSGTTNSANDTSLTSSTLSSSSPACLVSTVWVLATAVTAVV